MSFLKKISQNHWKYKHWYYLFPALIIAIIFNFYTLNKTFLISLDSGYNKFADVFSYYFNFKNYRNIFVDQDFLKALLNTFLLVLTAVPLSIFISLMIALGLNNVYNRFLKKFFQTVFFLPYLANSVIMGMVFAVLFYHNIFAFKDSSEGLINQFFNSSRDWINPAASYFSKMFVLVIYVVWRSLPFQILIFSVSLQNIGKNYFDAARVDGASKMTIFRKITLPLLSPIVFYQIIITMIQVFKEYESVVGIYGTNELKVNTIVGYIYHQISNPVLDSYSKGAAATIILFLISIFFTLFNFFFIKKKINRE
ncbi:ABC-type sugar transport system, permease protein [Candidatus Phytoplasma solani]|uniref:carbohydrate ABC transporter permease n=1 Tax=Candidatus Phytoplasma solani TaxID=69896 RepID=UPI0032D9E1C7